MTFHNIHVQGSVVGAINTGQVQQIDVAIDHIKLGGDQALAQAWPNLLRRFWLTLNYVRTTRRKFSNSYLFLSVQTATLRISESPE